MLVNVSMTCDGDVEMGIGQVASVGLGEQMLAADLYKGETTRAPD